MTVAVNPWSRHVTKSPAEFGFPEKPIPADHPEAIE
jgi:hypothetical protein